LFLHGEVEKVRRARDAGVVVANGLLALPDEFVMRKLEAFLDEAPQVRLDARLVL
jgi:hypothetical protein